jgi:peroxiredoxin Q/BCP
MPSVIQKILGSGHALRVGDQAPDFTLPDTEGRPVTLSKLLQKGPVALFFFPKAFTPGCMQQTANFRDKQASFEHRGAQIVAISTDSVATLKRFKEDRKAQYTFLSDAQKAVVPGYSGLMPVIGLARRANYVIDRTGVVVFAVHGNAAIDPAAAEGACPAGSAA